MNFMRSSKAEYKVLYLSWGTPLCKYRLGDEWVESSPAKKDFGVLVNEKLM